MPLAQNVIQFRLSDEVLTEESLRIVSGYLEDSAAAVIHLDLGDVQLPTADGLGALVVLNQELRERGVALVLCNVRAAVYEVFLVAHLIDVLDVCAI